MRSASSRAIARPEAGALRVVGGEEGLEDALQVAALDAGAEVGHRQPHAPVAPRRGRGRRRCRPACGSARCRSGSAGSAPPAQGRTRPRPVRRSRRSSRCDSCARERRRELGGDALGELADVGRLGAQLERAASSRDRSSSSVASLRRRSTCSRSWSRNGRARLLVEVLVLEQLEEAAEREDRRAQLVRGGGDELLARAVSSSASWRCMSSSVRASWPSSSRASDSKRAAKSPAATLRAARSRRLTRRRSARATQVAGEQRDDQRERRRRRGRAGG